MPLSLPVKEAVYRIFREALGNVTPRYSWQIDPSKLKMTGQEGI